MIDEPKDSLRLVLCHGVAGNRISVELESFLRFNADMDYALGHMVDRWSDYMTPSSLRTSRRLASGR